MLSKEKLNKILKSLRERDLIEITWVDHAGELGWQRKEQLLNREPFVCVTVGYYVGESRDYITVADTYDPFKNYNGMHFTIKNCITSIRKIKH